MRTNPIIRALVGLVPLVVLGLQISSVIWAVVVYTSVVGRVGIFLSPIFFVWIPISDGINGGFGAGLHSAWHIWGCWLVALVMTPLVGLSFMWASDFQDKK